MLVSSVKYIHINITLHTNNNDKQTNVNHTLLYTEYQIDTCKVYSFQNYLFSTKCEGHLMCESSLS